MRYFCHVFDEWIEVSAKTHAEWRGARCTLNEEGIMDNNGWTIEKQRKSYGPHVEIVLNGKLEVTLKASNPAGLRLEGIQKKLDTIPPTRANADKLGFGLQWLFEEIDAMASAPGAVFEVPKDQLTGEEPTVITPARREPSSPFSR